MGVLVSLLRLPHTPARCSWGALPLRPRLMTEAPVWSQPQWTGQTEELATSGEGLLAAGAGGWGRRKPRASCCPWTARAASRTEHQAVVWPGQRGRAWGFCLLTSHPLDGVFHMTQPWASVSLW